MFDLPRWPACPCSVIRLDGALNCWGNTVWGTHAGPVRAVAMAEYHACFALLATGQVVCWFTTVQVVYNRQEYSRSASVVPDSANADIVALAAGAGYQTAHTCGLKKQGTIVCWGS